ncbi:MAG: alcohol dehydrogenase [Nitrospirae bacterium RIFCSPLOW2_12_42_9]|nr:MAG: alcohol dehydrogenase [Nitrospirae bacterium RIFCSPLOW2_12_42_9]HBI24750.1 alcohol dehydrogenase [Nitrospiraceae bacterium]
MRVAMYYNNKDIRLEEMPVPEIGPGELLIKIIASGICGSDLMEWYRIHKAPLVLGHEIAGMVEKIGDGVTQYRKGDRVSASHHVPCNNCHYCLNGHHTVCDMLRKTKFYPGGFAEYVLLPAINVDRGVYTLPDEVSYEDGSFVEPLACVFRGQRLAGLKPGSSVLVIGSGISGLLHIQLAQALGAGRIVATDINEFRLDAAKRAGANYTINALDYSTELLRDINDGRLADLVIICTGAATAINQGLESVERGGTILFFAATDKGVTIPISFNDLLFRNEVTLMSSYAGNRADHMTALDLIRSKRVRVKELITHRLDLEETELGFKLVAEGKNSIKVIIEPQK